jgi:cell division protein FtsI/penicillin-binding protein 2
VGLITAGQYNANRHLGYTQQDLFGRSGLEFSLELAHLRGTPGVQRIEVNRAGRRIGTPQVIEAPIPGDKVFLSIDLELQRAAYYVLKEYLTEALISRLSIHPQQGERVTQELSVRDAFISFVRSGNLDIRRILDTEPGNAAYAMHLYILERDRSPVTNRERIENIQRIIVEGLEKDWISPAKMLLTLIGTGQINDPEGIAEARLTTRPQDALPVLIEKLRAWELTPQQFNIDPSTGSIVILDVHTGGVLAAVSYPSFDNNRMANVVDVDYFNRINNDPSRPMIYRPFREARAPGSTFKMISAVAVLESGVISTTARITDGVVFTRAGAPHTRCWASFGHGSINIVDAIAVSCNYFFCEATYRLGNTPAGTRMQGIQTLNRYMEYFGLNTRSGVELREYIDDYDILGDSLTNRMSSPQFKEYLIKRRFPYAARYEWDWQDGDTVRTSIGQAFNDVTPAVMVKYIAQLANRGVRYPLSLVGKVTDHRGNVIIENNPRPEDTGMTVSDRTWNAVLQGMRETITRGTAEPHFRGFNIAVAGKTGTAEQQRNRPDHSSFGGYAPYENPQIAVYVSIPYGVTPAMNAIATRIARVVFEEFLIYESISEPPVRVNVLVP